DGVDTGNQRLGAAVALANGDQALLLAAEAVGQVELVVLGQVDAAALVGREAVAPEMYGGVSRVVDDGEPGRIGSGVERDSRHVDAELVDVIRVRVREGPRIAQEVQLPGAA